MEDHKFFKNIKQSLSQPPRQVYQSTDWEQLSHQLDEKEEKKVGGWWKFVTVFLLLGIAGSWYFLTDFMAIEKTKTPFQLEEDQLSIPENNINTEDVIADLEINNKKKNNDESIENKTTISTIGLTTKNKTILLDPSGSNLSSNDAISQVNNFLIKKKTNPIVKTDQYIHSNLNAKNNTSSTLSNSIERFSNSNQPFSNNTFSILEKIPSLEISELKHHWLAKFDKKTIEIKKQYSSDSGSNPLKDNTDLDPEKYSKRRMIGVYGGIPFMKKVVPANNQNPLLLGVRGRYFIRPKFNLDVDIFLLRFKEQANYIFNPPTPSYVFLEASSRDLWFQYQIGGSYWFGKSRVWHPYLGASLGGAILAIDEDTQIYNNTITGENETSFQRDTYVGFMNSIPIYANFRAGLLYRFKNPRFNCQLEIIHNQMFIKDVDVAFLPSIMAGVFYHF